MVHVNSTRSEEVEQGIPQGSVLDYFLSYLCSWFALAHWQKLYLSFELSFANQGQCKKYTT